MPTPGGEVGAEEIQVTGVADVIEIIELTKESFQLNGLQSAWERVAAVVVQPGMDFFNDHIQPYSPNKAKPLSDLINSQPGLVYEAHSTDYQSQTALNSLVHDHFMILKVGPELTFAYREGIFALEKIEQVLSGLHPNWRLSKITETLDEVMCKTPNHWRKHYQGSTEEQAIMRQFSYRDRIRYYWANKEVQRAVRRLLANLDSCEIPLPLLSQYLPIQHQHIQSGKLKRDSISLLSDKVFQVLERYSQAST